MKLKPCPFCGSESKMIKISETGYRIECANLACGVIARTSVAVFFARANADAAKHIIEKLWNTRAEEPKAESSTTAPDSVNHPSHYETNDMPTAAEPMKHGTWIEKKPSRMKWIPDENDDITEEETTVEDMIEQKCSVCQRWSIKFANHIEMNFCPHCGCKMITRGRGT